MSMNFDSSLKIELLGPFRLSIFGQKTPIEAWKSRKALFLLKYLAARFGEKIPSDVLIDVLWPTNEFETAPHNLHTTVYLLRKTLKEHMPQHLLHVNWIHFSNGLYWLDTSDKVFVDADEFLRLCRESEDLEQEDPLRALEVGLAALPLYRGDFLQEDLYADWATTVRDNCRTKYVELAMRTSQLLVKYKADYKSAILICRSALHHASYLEELHQILMRCLIMTGRLPEALLQYNACAKTLREELDLEPSEETKAIIRQTKYIPEELINPAQLNQNGVLICDRTTFHFLVGLAQRHADRKQQPLVLMSITVDESATREHIHTILQAISKSMRRSDVATHWSTRVVVLLLFETNAQGCYVVQERIRKNLGNISSLCKFSTHLLTTHDEYLFTALDDSQQKIVL